MRKIVIITCLLFFDNLYCQNANLLVLEAKTLYNQKMYSESIKILNESDIPYNAYTSKLKADCYYRLNNTEKALKFYITADSIEKGYATFEISKCYALLNKPTEACTWLEIHLSQPDKKTEAEINLEKAFQPFINTPEWKKLWQKEWYSASDITKSSVYSYLKYGNTNNAIEILDKNENKIFPKHEYYALRAKTFLQMNLLEPAYVSISKAIELNKRSDEYFIIRATIASKIKDYKQSISDYSKAVNLNPYEISYYSGRANINLIAENNSDAEEDIKILKNITPSSEETLLLLAKLETAKEEYLEALKYYDKLIALGTSKSDYFVEKGNVEYFLERYQQADDDFNKALDINPNIPEVYLKKGKIYIYLLDSERACFFLEKAKELGNQEAAKLIIENCLKIK